MKIDKRILGYILLAISFCATGCRRSTDEVWEDTKSASRHMGRGIRTMGGKRGDSRQIRSREDFYGADGYDSPPVNEREAFMPLTDNPAEGEIAMADIGTALSQASPGDPGSPIPGIEAFQDPKKIPEIAPIFQNIQFDYNSHLVKGINNLETIRAIAVYLKQNPRVYVFIEGHTDERGAEAYNLALGSRRSNMARNALISEGIAPERLFTVSYGRERPLTLGHDETSWAQNRRAEFKIYVR